MAEVSTMTPEAPNYTTDKDLDAASHAAQSKSLTARWKLAASHLAKLLDDPLVGSALPEQRGKIEELYAKADQLGVQLPSPASFLNGVQARAAEDEVFQGKTFSSGRHQAPAASATPTPKASTRVATKVTTKVPTKVATPVSRSRTAPAATTAVTRRPTATATIAPNSTQLSAMARQFLTRAAHLRAEAERWESAAKSVGAVATKTVTNQNHAGRASGAAPTATGTGRARKNLCLCGCGEPVAGMFKLGHVAHYRSGIQNVERGLREANRLPAYMRSHGGRKDGKPAPLEWRKLANGSLRVTNPVTKVH